jgi:hypothetical protein
MRVSLLSGDAGANGVTGSLPFEAFMDGATSFVELRLGLHLERRGRGRQGIGHDRAKAGDCRDQGTYQSVSTYRDAHR